MVLGCVDYPTLRLDRLWDLEVSIELLRILMRNRRDGQQQHYQHCLKVSAAQTWEQVRRQNHRVKIAYISTDLPVPCV